MMPNLAPDVVVKAKPGERRRGSIMDMVPSIMPGIDRVDTAQEEGDEASKTHQVYHTEGEFVASSSESRNDLHSTNF